jgi:hypothetical protein
MKIQMFFSLAALLFLEAAPLTAQIPPSEMPNRGLIPGSMASTTRKMVSPN